MKRSAILLIALVLCCICVSSGAAFDLKPYMYEERNVILFDRNTHLFLTSDDTTHRIRLEQNGFVIQETTMEKKGNRLTAILGDEGNIGLISRPDLAGGRAEQMYYRWKEDNTLSDGVLLSDDAGFLYACGNGFYGANNDGEIFVCDADGVMIFSRKLYITPMDCVRNADGTYLIAGIYEDIDRNEKEILVERVDGNGMVIWQTVFSGKYGFDGCVLSDDGQGGAFLVKTDDRNYKIAQVYRIDGNGDLTWTKQLEAEGLILHAFCGGYSAQEGGLVIDGNVVSKSKGVYKVIRLVITGDGQIISASARDFSCRPDYSFTIERAVDGSVFARSDANYLDTKNTKHVLVPVDELPETSVPVLTLK